MSEATEARPKAGHVFVTRTVRETTESGLVLATDKQDTVFEGRLHAVGPDCVLDIGVGARIVFQPWQSSELEIRPGVWVFSIPQNDLLGELEDDEP